ncbi:hypothetical protein [Virgibacillus oceani]|uniref:hypothetical protein n=1 Tax=Virgibacillus oceani TaxID=1479511 RepID=UPI00166F58A3|nr:hypothetical protein [Virgibacillus oceani]
MASFLGLIAGISSILLWLILSFFNPYADPTKFEPMITTFFMLLLPACLAIHSAVTSKHIFMLIAFFWSLPISLYMVLTPSIFGLFGAANVLYLVSFILMQVKMKKTY